MPWSRGLLVDGPFKLVDPLSNEFDRISFGLFLVNFFFAPFGDFVFVFFPVASLFSIELILFISFGDECPESSRSSGFSGLSLRTDNFVRSPSLFELFEASNSNEREEELFVAVCLCFCLLLLALLFFLAFLFLVFEGI